MVTRHTLDVKFGVRIPTPQPKTHHFGWVGLKGESNILLFSLD